MERRELFKIIAAGALTEAAVQARRPFFDVEQTAVLDRLSDIIIPSDDQSPGAHEAQVVHYLDLVCDAFFGRRPGPLAPRTRSCGSCRTQALLPLAPGVPEIAAGTDSSSNGGARGRTEK
jgi:hypothetical protein